MIIPAGLRKALAFGSGVGIEIAGAHGAETLRALGVRVRPGGAVLLGEWFVDDINAHAAGIWGADYARFLKQHGLSHVPATIVLARRDVIVRQIAMPGISDKDLPAAIQFQMEGLHPYPEDEAVSSWTRLPGTSSVLIAITRRAVIERFSALFAEAGIKIASFTCSAAAIYSARRIFGAAPSAGVLAYEDTAAGIEMYGESEGRPVFSATFDTPIERAATLAASELRLDPGILAISLKELLGTAPALPFAAALSSACPLLSLSLNLLPADSRERSSRALWIPSAALGLAVLLLAMAFWGLPGYESRRYQRSLEAEIAKLQPSAARLAELDRQIEDTQKLVQLLDQFRSRSRADLDVLSELTQILPAPTWLNLLDITRTDVLIGGETPQTAPLLGTIDASPFFQNSEFAMPPSRLGAGGEAFRIRTKREAGK